MRKTKFTRFTALFLAVLMLCGAFGVTTAATSVASDSDMTASELRELLNSDSYSVYSNKFYTTDANGDRIEAYKKGTAIDPINGADVYSYKCDGITYYRDPATSKFYYLDDAGVRVDVADSDIAVKIGTFEGEEDAIFSPASGTLVWEVTIPASGRYAVEIEYYPLGSNTSAIERMFYIDGKIPFAQARYISLSKIWKYDYQYDDNGNVVFNQDKNGNELKPVGVVAPEWQTVSFTDPDGFYQGAFEFIFNNEGKTDVKHTISLEATREEMYIKSIRLYPCEELPSYADVLEDYKANNYQAASSNAVTMLEAEKPYRVSDTSVFAATDRTSAANSPISASAQLLNVLGSTSYNTIGQWAGYKFTVEEAGLYTISIRCKQERLAGMYTSRTIRMAGGIYGDTPIVPFAEAYNTRFNYDKSWQIATLGDGNSVFQFYFEPGIEYELYLDVSLGTLAEIIESVETSLDVINGCYLEILKLTGADPDEYRDYGFTRVMPKTVNNLLKQSKVLDSVSKGLVELSGSSGSHVATLDKVSFLLETMGLHEDKIASNLDDLKSYIGTLGTWLNTSKQQSLAMDYIIVNGSGTTSYEATVEPQYNKKTYKKDASFFEAIWFEVVSFFNSFFINYDEMGVTINQNSSDVTTSVEVWLATGRDQATIWRGLIDSEFTSQEIGQGIAVNLKLVTANTLLPSVLAKQGPDTYMGLDSGNVINYAIRNAVLPMTKYVEQDPDILHGFNDATLVPLSMFNDIYGVPETVSFSMMFYRKDILANLGLDVPRTWDELLTSVPVLQSSNMEIGLTRNYNMFLYQAGGDQWTYGGSKYEGEKYAELLANDPNFASYFDYMQIGYGTNEALEAFKFMCRFYTDYGFPVTFDAANRFRTGEMPLVISDAVGMYNQLTVFATEIRGLWMFTNVPGTEREDGTISDLSIAGVTAVVMLNGVEDAEATWRFIKWQIGAEGQAKYGNSMVSLIGPSAKYNTANMDAIAMMSWTTDEANSLLNQFNKLATVPNYPGAYIIARYLDFAFLNTYNDGMQSEEQLQGYIKTINSEINRKRQEFDLPTQADGTTVDDSIDAYLQYLKGLSDEELAEYSEYVQNYVKSL